MPLALRVLVKQDVIALVILAGLLLARPAATFLDRTRPGSS
jgi:hypothetical protein